MTQCTNVGELTVGGKVVGLLRCQLEAGHEEAWIDVDQTGADVIREPATPHRATLEWSVDGAGVALIDWPEANNPDERFDADPMA